MPRRIRKKPTKFSVAIVGEGITEWHYFDGFRQVLRLNFKIKPELPKNSSYTHIFKKAKDLISEGYDEVFCVPIAIGIDVDDINCNPNKYQKYQTAKAKVLKHNQIKVFESMPCIEYWFLLHFMDYSTKIYPTYDSLKSELKKYLKGYEKSKTYFEKVKLYQTLITLGDEEKATILAELLDKEKKNQENVLFPYSDIYKVLEYLRGRN